MRILVVFRELCYTGGRLKCNTNGSVGETIMQVVVQWQENVYIDGAAD